ncbi:MAG TPA: hypothetical protein VF936_11810 [Burkholderiales bacterium]
MRVWLAGAIALCLSAAAWAAPLTEDDAVRIGREASVEGLRALIVQHNPVLIYRATASWNFGASRTLPEPLEALVVEHYADRAIQRSLLGLLARQIDKYQRYPKYRSRKLFDLLYADLKSGQDSQHYAIVIIATDLPVEPELAALLPGLDPAAANELVMFLGDRKFAPALPALQALQAKVPHERNTNQMLERVDWAYLQIGTPGAMQALIARLRALGQMKDERAGAEVWNLLVALSQQAPGSPPDYGELRAALPAELNDSAWDQLIRLIEKRKEKRGILDLLRAIAQSKRTDQAVEALLAVGGPDDWRVGRAELERAGARLPPERIASLQKKLDDAAADPGKFAAAREQRERTEAMYRAQGDFIREKSRISALRAKEPKRYATELRALLDRREAELRTLADLPAAVGARNELAREYLQLAVFQRFELRQPDEAIAAYERAGRLLPDQPFNIAASVADVYRFDKRDTPKALEQYRRAHASFPPGRSSEERMLAVGLQQWLEHEIAYLERGQRFSGAIRRADMGTGQFWLMLASVQTTGEPPPEARVLSRLPPSQLQIARAFPAVLELEPKEMLGFFAKHDPAGYLTAAILAAASAKEPSPYVKAAAETFFRERGIRGGPAARADARYASPEKTWATFMAATSKGDVAAMLDCLMPDVQERFQELFKRMSRDELRKTGESFVGFAMSGGYGEFREATVVRQQKDKKIGGIITFVKDGGEWKIANM